MFTYDAHIPARVPKRLKSFRVSERKTDYIIQSPAKMEALNPIQSSKLGLQVSQRRGNIFCVGPETSLELQRAEVTESEFNL